MTAVWGARFDRQLSHRLTVRASLERPAEGFSITVLFGPSGAGKTTILRCIAGLETPDTGRIHFAGSDWFNAEQKLSLSPQQRGVGFLFQEYALFPHLSVAENIAYGLDGATTAERGRVVDEMLDRLGLSGFQRRRTHMLSGGEAQRVALGRALARRPRLLLLDEPLSALDQPTRDALRHDLRRWLKAAGVPVVMVTHDRTEAIALADYVYAVEGGAVRQGGTTSDVFSRPADLAVARIVGTETVEAARVLSVSEGLARVQVGTVELTAVARDVGVGEAFVCIRAEEVILQAPGGTAGSARNRFTGPVRSLTAEGPMVRVTVDCGFLLAALVTRPACEELGIREGSTVAALVKAPSIHLIARAATS